MKWLYTTLKFVSCDLLIISIKRVAKCGAGRASIQNMDEKELKKPDKLRPAFFKNYDSLLTVSSAMIIIS